MDTATTGIYTLSLHDALPIWRRSRASRWSRATCATRPWYAAPRSEEHTSELQSRGHLVCRLLLEKKKHEGVRGRGAAGVLLGERVLGFRLGQGQLGLRFRRAF